MLGRDLARCQVPVDEYREPEPLDESIDQRHGSDVDSGMSCSEPSALGSNQHMIKSLIPPASASTTMGEALALAGGVPAGLAPMSAKKAPAATASAVSSLRRPVTLDRSKTIPAFCENPS